MTITLPKKLAQITRAIAFTTLTGMATLAPTTSGAQNLFAPIASVNDRVITAYELSQRMAFMRLLRAPGDIKELAMNQLVNERLQLSIAEQMGVTITEEQLSVGLAEFAARANLETEQFLTAIAQGGVAAESFRDFVAAGVVWREVARKRFLSSVRISSQEIDRAIASADASVTQSSEDSLEYAQYFIPGGRTSSALADAAKISSRVDTCDDLYTIANGQPEEVLTRETLLQSQIPADIARELAGLDAGEISTALTRNNGATLVFLMLCERTKVLVEALSREDVRSQLRNRRIQALATSFLEEKRADANIEVFN